jgi:hypothetical protein
MNTGVGHQPWLVILTDLKNMSVCQEWDKQDFNLFEEMRRIDLLWKIVEYRASLL